MILNKVIIYGRLTHNPELRQTPSGVSALRFTIASDRPKPKDGGEQVTDFLEVSAFDKRAELVARSFRKGSGIIVIGRLQVRQWETKSGEKRKNIEISADEIVFTDKYDPTIFEDDKPVVSVPGKPDPVRYDSPAYNDGNDTGSSFIDVPDEGDLPF